MMYRIDFSMSRGHEMIVERIPAIRREELDEIELQMLQCNNRIPHMLPMEWSDMDGAVSFRYSLSGRKMLSHRLQMHRLSMEQFYALLLAVVEVLTECKDYMLRPEGCMLDDHRIFVDEELTDIGIAYMPLRRNIVSGESADAAAVHPAVGGELLSLIVRWTTYVHKIDGAGLQRLLHHFYDQQWPLAELRLTLLDLIAGDVKLEAASNGEIKAYSSQAASWPHSSSEAAAAAAAQLEEGRVWRQNIRLSVDKDSYQERMGCSESSVNCPPDFKASFEEEADEEWTGEPSSRKGQWYISLAALLAVAALWRFLYLPSPSRNSLYICLGLTMMGAAAAAAAWMKRNRSFMQREDRYLEEFVPESRPLVYSAAAISSNAMPQNKEAPDMANDLSADWEMKKPLERLIDLDESDQSESNRRRAPAAIPEATVLLEPDAELPPGNRLLLWRESDDRKEPLSWKGERFTIGRAGEKVDYEEEAPGISRLHLEIERKNTSFKAKDLGSRNGSMLNGRVMIPYKSYPLSAGDSIQLAGPNGPKYVLQ
ncbi:DUF6382 domain-containing protein [Paenibacillus sp. NEAU-GSW1]|uniref:DUF6382 domain-containing protein n=1 Tax=Paenibacillus sp. NEAU-GSW1 TaxID=2682486 RepID=UPI0012E28747|nr:DUF6382 domain-containing protein [Paenibacillus sp. NEAU-GSW1]MUT68072.1 FHA domain-containing protein [Paenibacillus sp. NEAU-GSW1]